MRLGGGEVERPQDWNSGDDAWRRFLEVAAEEEPALLKALAGEAWEAFRRHQPDPAMLLILLDARCDGSWSFEDWYQVAHRDCPNDFPLEDFDACIRTAEALWRWAERFHIRHPRVFRYPVWTLALWWRDTRGRLCCPWPLSWHYGPVLRIGPELDRAAPSIQLANWNPAAETWAEYETRARAEVLTFLDRALLAYRDHIRRAAEAEGFVATPEKRADRHFRWFVRNRLQGWPTQRIAEKAQVKDWGNVDDALNSVSRLLNLPRRRTPRGRPTQSA